MSEEIANQTNIFNSDVDALKELERQVTQGIDYNTAYSATMTQASTTAQKHAVETKGCAGATNAFIEKQKATQTALQGTAKSLKATTIAMRGLTAVGNIAFGIIATQIATNILTGAAKIIDSLHESEKEYAERIAETKQRLEESEAQIKSLSDEYKEFNKTTKDTIKRYAELSQGVDLKNNNNLSLAQEDYEEFLDLSNQLGELFPTLQINYDRNGNAILDLTGDIDTITNKLQGYLDIEKQLKQDQILEQSNEVIKNTFPLIDDLNQQINDKLLDINQKLNNAYSSIDNKKLYEQITTENDFTSIGANGQIKYSVTTLDQKELIQQALDAAGLLDFGTIGVDVSGDSFSTEGLWENIENEAGEIVGYTLELSNELSNKLIGYGKNINNALGEITLDNILSNEITLSNYSKEIVNLADEIKKLDAEINGYNQKLSMAIMPWWQNKLNSTNSDGSLLYAGLQSEESQNVLGTVLSNVNWNELIDSGTFTTYDEMYTWAEENIIAPLNAVMNDLRVSPLFEKVISGTATSEDITRLRELIQEYFAGNPIVLDFAMGQIDTYESEFTQKQSQAKEIFADIGLKKAVDHNGQTLGYKTSDGGYVTEQQYRDFFGDPEKLDMIINNADLFSDPSLITPEMFAYTDEQLQAWIDNQHIELEADIELTYVQKMDNMQNNLGDGFDQLDKIYADVYNKEDFDWSSILGNDDFKNTFGELNNVTLDYQNCYDEFIKAITSNSDDIDACQEAFNNLTSAFIYESGVMNDLSEDTKEATIAFLEQKGVANAVEIVENRLAAQQLQLANGLEEVTFENGKLSDSSYEAIESLYKEAEAGDATYNALFQLMAEQNIFNNSTLDVSQKISALMAMAKAAGIAATAVANATSIMNAKSSAKSNGGKGGSWIAYEMQKKGEEQRTGTAYGSDAYLNKMYDEIIDQMDADFGTTNISDYNYSGGNTTKSEKDSGGGGSDSEQEPTEETFDWIEIKIQRLEEAIARLDKTASFTYSDWETRNKAIGDQISKTTEEIDVQKKAYEAYMKEANAIGLSDDYVAKIQSGELDIETIKDNEELVEKINKYQEWYNKAVACNDAIQDLTISLSDLAQTKFDNISKQFEDMQSVFENTIDQVDGLISLAESKGRFVSKSYYQTQMNEEYKNHNSLVQQRDAMQAELDSMLEAGTVVKYSEAWYALYNDIASVDKAIIDSTVSLQEYSNEMRQVDWDIFDYERQMVEDFNGELEFMNSLLSHEKITDGLIENGLTEYGNAQMGNMGARYNIYLAQSQAYAGELKKINADIAKDPANKDLLDRRQELLKAQQDNILSAQDERQAMIDLAREGYDAVLESLQEMIDKKKELLSSEKDLYDYQRNIADQTDNIASLRKQLSVYQNDDSEEGKKRQQELSTSLEEAEQQLQDTEYDRYIQDQERILDELYQAYSDTIDEKFENTDILFTQLINGVNANADTISNAISTVAEDVGYTMSPLLQQLWGSESGIVSTISANIQAMVTAAQTEAEVQVPTPKVNTPPTPAPVKSPAPAPAPTPAPAPAPAPQKSTNTGDGVPKVGDKVTFISGKYTEDSWGRGNSGSKNLNGQVYITKISPYSGSTRPYHISTGTSLGQGDLGWVTLDQLKGYKTGLKYAKDDELAWTQEEGLEIIRRSDGALLTPITHGSTVFTNEMTENLWNLAQGKMINTGAPNIPTGISKNENCAVNIGNITLPNVTNPEEFSSGLVNALKHDTNVVKAIRSVTIDTALGKNSKKVNKY